MFFLSASCVPRETVVEGPPAYKPSSMPVEEQNKKAFEVFNQMLELTAENPRETVLPKIEEGYAKIIAEYPDSYLAEESFMRLIMINFEEYPTARVERAEELYREYFKRYPKPRLDVAINNTMALLYYRYARWDRLVAFCIPFVEQYVKTGKFESTMYLFYYSEGRFNMKDYKEAEKGYRLVIKHYKGADTARIAGERLKQIEGMPAGSQK